MLFVENTDYLNEIESFISKKNDISKIKFFLFKIKFKYLIVNFSDNLNYGNLNKLRQLFFDCWFSEEKLPEFKNENSLFSIFSYFMNKINELSSKNLNIDEIMRINSIYSDFANQIINFIEKGDFSLKYNLEEVLYDNQFFKIFLLRLISNENFEKKFLALSKVKIIIL